ncbi:MAG: thiamine diphosphokinase [Clostridiales bacterium]|nr:thiamine diphosphokinase [Clostridiales bacterium]
MEKMCVIFGAGEAFPPKRSFTKSDLIIAADGGYSAVKSAGLDPNVVIGDFDSSTAPEGIAAHVVKLKREKDDTDMLAAIKLGLRREYKTFVLYGGVGGRLDHTVANLAALRYLNNFDAHGFLIDRDTIATVITDETFVIPKTAEGTVSVFAYGGEATGVKLSSLYYPLDNATLSPDFPLGVSNATVSGKSPATVSVKHGSLLIFFPR